MDEVVEGVRVLEVSVDGADVLVDLIGGPQNVCASVRFVLPDDARRHRAVAALHSWRDRATPLTFVASGASLALVDSARTVERLAASEASPPSSSPSTP
jgi:hypothetical protein